MTPGSNGNHDPVDLSAALHDVLTAAEPAPVALDPAASIAESIRPLDLSDDYRIPDPILSVIGKDLKAIPLVTPGKVGLLTAPSGAAKSSVVAAIASGVVNRESTPLQFVVDADRCVWIDTEQEPYELAQHARTTLRRAGIADQFHNHDRLHVYPASKIRNTPDDVDTVNVLRHILHQHIRPDERGILLVDGIADLVPSILDEKQALHTLRQLESLVHGSDWCIFGTLHENRAGSPRGWIGTEAVNRSSATIGIERHQSGRLHIHASKAMHKVRRGDQYQISTWISWDDEQRMFTVGSAPSATSERADRVVSALRQVLPDTFRAADALQPYRDATGKTDTEVQAVQAWIKRSAKAGVLLKVGTGLYRFRDTPGAVEED